MTVNADDFLIKMLYETFLKKEKELNCKLAMDYNLDFYKYITLANNFCNLIPIEVGEGNITKENVSRDEIFFSDEIRTERFKTAVLSPKLAVLSPNNSQTVAEVLADDGYITGLLSTVLWRMNDKKADYISDIIEDVRTIYRIFPEPYKSVGKEIELKIFKICDNTGRTKAKKGQKIEGGAATTAIKKYFEYKEFINSKKLMKLNLLNGRLETLVEQQQRMIDFNKSKTEGLWNFILKYLPFLKIKKENKEQLKIILKKSLKVILTISGVIIISITVYKRYYKKETFSDLKQQTIEMITPTNTQNLTEAEAEKLIKLFAKAKGVKIYEWRQSLLKNYLLQQSVGTEPQKILQQLDSLNSLIH